MVKKKNKVIILIVILSIGLLIGYLGIKQFTKFDTYLGNGFAYLTEDGNDAILTILNDDGKYEEKLGTKSDYFWITTYVDNNETLAIDNKDIIYLMKKDKIKKYSGIAENIIAVNKVEDNMILVCQKRNKVTIEVYATNFEKKVYETNVEGEFDYLFKDKSSIYYSVHNENRKNTKVYCLNIEEFINNEIYNTNEVMEIYPYKVKGETYIIKNQIIREIGNVPVNKLYKISDKSEKKLMELSENIISVKYINDKIYFVEGNNDSKILKYNCKKNLLEELFYVSNENIETLYDYKNSLYVVSNKNVYRISNNKMMKKYGIGYTDLTSEFN